MLAGAIASACTRKRAVRYHGWLFVASRGDKAVAVADLAFFRRETKIPLPHPPDQLFSARGQVFAVSHEGQSLIEIDSRQFRVAGKIALPGRPHDGEIGRGCQNGDCSHR